MDDYQQLVGQHADRINYAWERAKISGDSLESSLLSPDIELAADVVRRLSTHPIFLHHFWPEKRLDDAVIYLRSPVNEDNPTLFAIKCASVPGYDSDATRELLENPLQEDITNIKLASSHERCKQRGSCSCRSETYYAASLVRDKTEKMRDDVYLKQTIERTRALIEVVGGSTKSLVTAIDKLVNTFITDPTFTNYRALLERARMPPPPQVGPLLGGKERHRA